MPKTKNKPTAHLCQRAGSPIPDVGNAEIAASKAKAFTDPWDQRGIYIRLSKHRKAALLGFAQSMGSNDSPHQALSSCIEFATSSISAKNDRDIATLAIHSSDQFDENYQATLRRLEKIETSTTNIELAMTAKLDSLLIHVEQLANKKLDHGVDADLSNKIPLMSSWLNSTSTMPLPADGMLLAKADWLATSPDLQERDCLRIVFEVGVLNDEGIEPTSAAQVQVVGVSRENLLASRLAMISTPELIMACQQTGLAGRWLVSFFPKKPDGQLDESIGSLTF